MVAGHNRTIPLSIQIKIINTFSYMAFLGDINLKNPNLQVGVFEEYEFDSTRGGKMVAAREKMGLSSANVDVKGKGKKKERDEEVWDQDGGKLKGVWIGRKVRNLKGPYFNQN